MLKIAAVFTAYYWIVEKYFINLYASEVLPQLWDKSNIGGGAKTSYILGKNIIWYDTSL